jgi:hypothetical protein
MEAVRQAERTWESLFKCSLFSTPQIIESARGYAKAISASDACDALAAAAEKDLPPKEPKPIRSVVSQTDSPGPLFEWAAANGDGSVPPTVDARAMLVTLDQAAAAVNRSKRTLEKYLGEMPPPEVEGGGGQAHFWDWKKLRPWLTKRFRVPLPERFPPN